MNNITPTVSVCVVTYNHEKYIARCLDGIVMQKTNFKVQAIIGEDCSTDGTRAVIRAYAEKYPELLHPIYMDKNVGASRNNFDVVYPHLTGKYIAICDGDDYWTDPYKLQKQVDFLDQNPDCVLCFHQVDTVDSNNNFLRRQEPSNIVTYYSWKEMLHISIPTLSVLYRNCVSEFPAEVYKVMSGDTFLFGMLSGFGGAADLGFVSACYRIHQNGVFQGKSLIEKYRQTIETRKMMAISQCFSPAQKREIRKEVRARKIRYMKQFARHAELQNVLRILSV